MKTLTHPWRDRFAVVTVFALLLVTASCAKQTEPNSVTDDAPAGDTGIAEVEIAELETGAADPRYEMIDDMGERAANGATAIPKLTKMLADQDPQIQWRSARALGDFGPEAVSAAPELRKLLAHADPIVQYHSAISLGKVGDTSEETVDALVNAVGISDPRVTRAAVVALRILKPGPVKVKAALKKALATEDYAVAAHALEAIVEIGGAASPLLIECLEDPATAYLAATAIEEIGPDAAPTVPALAELLDKTEHSQLEIRVLLALASIGPAAKPAAPQVLKVLETSKDATAPVAAAYALGAIDADEADAAMNAAMEKENPFLQMVAAWSLARLHPDDVALQTQAMEMLNAGMKSDDPAIKAAAEKGMKMLEPTTDAPLDAVAPE